MRIVLAGGGKVGFFLAQTLAPRHKVVLIEKDAGRCANLAEQLHSAVVIHGDASDLRTLDAAGVRDADVLAAVTGKDEDNLVICQLAKWRFKLERIVMRTSSPKNAQVFSCFEAGSTVSGTALIAQFIEEEFAAGDLHLLLSFRRGGLQIVELDIEEDAAAAGRLVRELGLPRGVTLISVLRKESVIAPNGDTRILPGDTVLAVSGPRDVEKLRTATARRRRQ